MTKLYLVALVGLIAMLAATGCQQSVAGQWSSMPDEGGEVASPSSRIQVDEQPAYTLDADAMTSASDMGSYSNASAAAIAILEQAVVAPFPQLRANAIEAMHPAPEMAAEYARQGLVDENRGVRFVAAMTIGKLRLCDASHLVEPLLLDESESVRAAAIYALRTCGQKVDLNPLADMMRSNDPEIRSNAALVLGMLGDESAAPMIEQAVGRGLELAGPDRASAVDLQLAEALVQLGRMEQVDTIRAKLFVPPESQELSAMAAVILGRLGDEQSAGAMERLIFAEGIERRPAEVRIGATMALAMLNRPVEAAWIAEHATSQVAEVRLQVALAMGEIGGTQALAMLERLLQDENPLVQVAAAGSVLRLDQGQD